jgi:hypothetical protein
MTGTHSGAHGMRKSIRLSGTAKVVAASLDHESALAVAYVQAMIKASGGQTAPASTVLRMAVRLLAAGISSWEPEALVSEAVRVSAIRKGDSVREEEARLRLLEIGEGEELPPWSWVAYGPNAGEAAERLTLRAEAFVEQLMTQPGWNLRLRRRACNTRQQ